ncbi:MAG: signal peptidase I [Halanaerobiales bacterium]
MLKIIFYGILYIVLTGCIIFYFVKDKYINKKIERLRQPLLDKIYSKFNIKKKSRKKTIVSIFEWAQVIIVALLLVFIINVFYFANYTVPTGSMHPTIKIGERFFADKISYKFIEPERGEIIVFREPFTNESRYTKRLIGLPGESVEIKNGDIFINAERIEFNHDFEYYNMGIMDDSKWYIPQEGDSIKLVEATIRYEYHNFSLEEFRGLLRDNPKLINERIFIETARFILNDEYLTGPIYDRDILRKLINGEKVTLTNDYYFALGDNSDNSLDSRHWGFVEDSRLLGRMLLRFWPISRFGLVD